MGSMYVIIAIIVLFLNGRTKEESKGRKVAIAHHHFTHVVVSGSCQKESFISLMKKPVAQGSNGASLIPASFSTFSHVL